MTRLGIVLRSVLALVLLGSNVPAWSGVFACGSGGHNLACIKACATATAFFTHDGKLPIVGRGSCHVKVQTAPAANVASAAPALSAPAHLVLAMAQRPVLPTLGLSAPVLDSRGPPPGGAYLSSRHPFANGPPTSL